MRTLDEWGGRGATPPHSHTATKKSAHARGVGTQSQSPLSATPPLLLGSLEHGLDLLLGLELEDLLGQRIGLGLGPLGDNLARAQN